MAWYKCGNAKCKYVWVAPKQPKKCPRCDSSKVALENNKKEPLMQKPKKKKKAKKTQKTQKK